MNHKISIEKSRRLGCQNKFMALQLKKITERYIKARMCTYLDQYKRLLWMIDPFTVSNKERDSGWKHEQNMIGKKKVPSWT